MKSFGDVYKGDKAFEPAFECKKVEFNEVLDQKIVVTGIKMEESKQYGEFPAVKFYFESDPNEEMFFTTFSGVLKKQFAYNGLPADKNDNSED
jgi:hypothetical protein